MILYLKQLHTNNYIVKGIVHYIEEHYQTDISLNLLLKNSTLALIT